MPDKITDPKEKARIEAGLAALLVKDSLDHMDKILRVARMPDSPAWARSLAAKEWEAITSGYRYLKEHDKEFKSHGIECPLTEMSIEYVCEDYEEMQEDYESYLKMHKGGM